MARIARVVAPGVPHHVTQRGNRRQRTFFSDDDGQLYRELMAAWCGWHGVAVWPYYLMPNHVHLIATPAGAAGPRRGRPASRMKDVLDITRWSTIFLVSVAPAGARRGHASR